MDLPAASMIVGLVVALIGYVNGRVNTLEKSAKMNVTESDVKELLNNKLEIVRLQQEQLKERLTRVEEVIDRMSEKIDRLLSR